MATDGTQWGSLGKVSDRSVKACGIKDRIDVLQSQLPMSSAVHSLLWVLSAKFSSLDRALNCRF